MLHLGIEFGASILRKIFTSKLPQDAKQAQIKEHFGQFGEVETVTLKTDMATGRSRGFCSIVNKFGWASLAALTALLPETVLAENDPVTNLIR